MRNRAALRTVVWMQVVVLVTSCGGVAQETVDPPDAVWSYQPADPSDALEAEIATQDAGVEVTGLVEFGARAGCDENEIPDGMYEWSPGDQGSMVVSNGDSHLAIWPKTGKLGSGPDWSRIAINPCGISADTDHLVWFDRN